MEDFITKEGSVEFLLGCYSDTAGKLQDSTGGIYSCTLDLHSGAVSEPRCLARCVNPSWLLWGPERRRLYAAKEVPASEGPALTSFSVSATGELDAGRSGAMPGGLPCHLCLDNRGRLLASAQYDSGDIALFRLDQQGEISGPASIIQHRGHGASPTRQSGPHAHFVAFVEEQNLLLAIDLGIDQVLGYALDPSSGEPGPQAVRSLSLPGGSGPRHLAFVPGTDTAFVLTELSEQIFTLRLAQDGWSVGDSIAAFELQAGAEGACAAIRISPDGRHLYVSGRRQSEIAGFAIDPISHDLSPVSRTASGGSGPRDFALSPDGRYVITANQFSNNLLSLRRDASSGILEPTGHSVTLASPVCILF